MDESLELILFLFIPTTDNMEILFLLTNSVLWTVITIKLCTENKIWEGIKNEIDQIKTLSASIILNRIKHD